MSNRDLRAACAQKLLDASARAGRMTAFVGLDGFVDEILQVVDKRENAENFSRLPTIARLAERLAAAAGRSCNLELVRQIIKLGGNGPIMANALARFGLKVIYVGTVGYPDLHPVFQEFGARAEIHGIAPPGTTDALEFEDGKIMVGKHTSLKEVTWENIQARFGRDKFIAKFGTADLVAFVNWTMLPYMSQLWEALLRDVCPSLTGPRRRIFFDLADPEKRTHEDIIKALDLIGRFGAHFDVILGLNEKEALEIAEVCGVKPKSAGAEDLAATVGRIAAHLKLDTLVVHPTATALAVSGAKLTQVQGPFVQRPKVTTGAGDHFNSGFCLGKLLGLDNEMSLLTGVATSGFYVRTAQSPAIAQLAEFLQQDLVIHMKLEVVKFGHPALRQKGSRIEKITPEIEELAAAMFEAMHAHKGIGLAAQQVGRTLQLTVLDLRGVTDRPSTLKLEGKDADLAAIMPLVLINPTVKPFGETLAAPEGCLSFPEMYGEIERPGEAEVRATDLKGRTIEFSCGGLLARAIQHENDHLNGILFIDRMKRDDKDELKSQLEELQAATKAALKKK